MRWREAAAAVAWALVVGTVAALALAAFAWAVGVMAGSVAWARYVLDAIAGALS